ncbi:ABC transporter permease [Micromonospora rubida]|uniref:ABC transporter permease n=1 Tax=Micromonospora rubida TaxID=2697657 RepID=UPI001378BC3C|nr:ABC transporter permease [Micromonospora rubida]NBE82855.1 ABC transporter permease [Micromonospora rubida]
MTTTDTRARFRDLLAAEWIKLWSLRSTYGVLAAGALICVGITTNSARSNVALIARSTSPLQRTALDPMSAAFLDEAFQILGIVACSVGAITVFGEYASGLIRTTFTAVPARRPVVLAKVVVVTAIMLVFGAIVSATSFGATQAIYHQEHIGLSITAPGALRAVAGSALLAPLCALVGMALGGVIRHAAGTIVAAVGLLLFLPALFQGETYRWVKEIGNAMVFPAWQALVKNSAHQIPSIPGRPTPGVDKYPVTLTEAWIVFAAWAVAAVVVAVASVTRRDP